MRNADRRSDFFALATLKIWCLSVYPTTVHRTRLLLALLLLSIFDCTALILTYFILNRDDSPTKR